MRPAPLQHQLEQQDGLILYYLNHINGLLRRYAASARLDYDDLRQDATLVIMRCLVRKPDQTAKLHGYIYVSVRNRIIDQIRYNRVRQAASLDDPKRPDSSATLADLIPSGHSVDPLVVILAKERLETLSTRQRKARRVQNAMALVAEVTR